MIGSGFCHEQLNTCRVHTLITKPVQNSRIFRTPGFKVIAFSEGEKIFIGLLKWTHGNGILPACATKTTQKHH